MKATMLDSSPSGTVLGTTLGTFDRYKGINSNVSLSAAWGVFQRTATSGKLGAEVFQRTEEVRLSTQPQNLLLSGVRVHSKLKYVRTHFLISIV